MGKNIFLTLQMKFALLVATAAAAADASVLNGAACAADKECKVATDSCCASYADKTNMDAGTNATKICCAKQAAAATKADANGKWVKTCAGRTAGAASLAASVA